MQVTSTNNVKIYNLSAGKSLPEWLTERKRRQLVKEDIEVRKRIELIQDFEMPAISDRIKVSADGQYVLSTGIYKPRLRCYDLHNLGLKFERCLDSEVVDFEILSPDYSKVVFLHCDRYVEFHSQAGRYYRLRIPVFGRDLCYDSLSAELHLVGSGSSVYRLSLEQGRFLNSLDSGCPGLNCVSLNPVHGLITAGSSDGRVVAWDPRDRREAGRLDCALHCNATPASTGEVTAVPEVTTVSHRDGMTLGVGTSTGQVLLYDIRSNKPLLTKDHMYGLPIKKVLFTGGAEGSEEEKVLSLDSQVVRIWDRETGKPYTSIESTADFNDLVLYPKSGLLFLANEQPRMQVFYIPSLGPAPRWSSFLDSLTEELEESHTATVYDDYKFVTKEDLIDLGLDHLIGSPLLRAHLHGFFMDIRLYRKASSAKPTNTLENLKKDLIKKQIEAQREGRVKIESKLPKVNKDLFMKMKVVEDVEKSKTKKSKKAPKSDLLEDDRFGALFTDDRFEIDTTEETFKLLNPVVSKLDKNKAKEFEAKFGVKNDDEMSGSGDSDVDMEESESDAEDSSDDEQDWTKEVKQQYKSIQREKDDERKVAKSKKQELKLKKITEKSKELYHSLSEVRVGEDLLNGGVLKKSKKSKLSLEERLEAEGEDSSQVVRSDTGHVMTFQPEVSKGSLKREAEEKAHRQERLKVRRSAKSLKKDKLPPKFWMGKRVR